jgi:acyl carrier protein phosphodiesterase
MNYLAHIFLSCDNEDLLIGNFIADFIRNREVALYAPSIQEGVFLHRQIDTYTDNHPVVKKGVGRLRPFHRKYAPVVIDILFDHLLVKNWSRYSEQKMSNFTENIYEIFLRRMDDMPPKLQVRLPNMIAADWLPAYGTLEGLHNTFIRMDKRTTFPSQFTAAVKHLQTNYRLFEQEFNEFFPEVIAFVNGQCAS